MAVQDDVDHADGVGDGDDGLTVLIRVAVDVGSGLVEVLRGVTQGLVPVVLAVVEEAVLVGGDALVSLTFSVGGGGVAGDGGGLGGAADGELCAVLVGVGGIVTISYAAHAAAGMEVVGQHAALCIVITGNDTNAP